MRCAECGLYECCMRTPLGGCPSGEKIDTSVEIVTTPNTGNGPWDKGYQPSGVQDPLREAAAALVEAVERYTKPNKGEFCHRTELLAKCKQLKDLL